MATRIVGGGLVSALVIGAIVVLAGSGDGRTLRNAGITPLREAWRAFLVGALSWLLPAGITFAILAVLGSPIEIVAGTGEVVSTVLLLGLAVFLSEAIPEELVFRGYVTGVLVERLRGGWGIAIQTALFALFALVLRGYSGVLDLSLFVAMGFVFGLLRMITRTVWTSVGFHTAFQTGSQLLLTHDVVEFTGSASLALLGLGTIPFAVSATFASSWPQLFTRRMRRSG